MLMWYIPVLTTHSPFLYVPQACGTVPVMEFRGPIVPEKTTEFLPHLRKVVKEEPCKLFYGKLDNLLFRLKAESY